MSDPEVAAPACDLVLEKPSPSFKRIAKLTGICLPAIGLAPVFTSEVQDWKAARLEAEIDREFAAFPEDMGALQIEMELLVTNLSGDTVQVRCGDTNFGDPNPEEGFIMGLYNPATPTSPAQIMIEAGLCAAILSSTEADFSNQLFAISNPDKSESAVDAVFTLSHEIAHAQGINNEGMANCIAVELFDLVAGGLQMKEDVTDTEPLAYAKATSAPDEYHSAGC